MVKISTAWMAESLSFYSQSDQYIPTGFSKLQIPEQIVPDFFFLSQ